MKVESKKEKVFTITMNEYEASILCALAGGASSKSDSVRMVMLKLYQELDAELPDRTESFSDFFFVP